MKLNERGELAVVSLARYQLAVKLARLTKHLATMARRNLTQAETIAGQLKKLDAMEKELDVVRRERAEAMGRSLERGRELEEAKNDLANANLRCEQWRESFERMRDNWHQQNLRRRRLAAKKKRANRGRK